MVSKKSKSHVHKKETNEIKTHDHNKEKKMSLDQIIPKDNNAWLSAGIFVLIGLIIGALVVGAMMPAQSVDDSCGVNEVNLAELSAKVGDYLNNNKTALGIPAEMNIVTKDINDEGDGFYKITVELSVDGEIVNETAIFSTENKLIIGPVINLNENIEIPEVEEPITTEFVKAEVADAELFVWGYCPGGIATLDKYAEAASALSEVANVSVVPFHDGHGAFETEQNKIMLAIQQVAPTKVWDYMVDFYDDVYPICSQAQTVECDLEESTKLMQKVGIDVDAVMEVVNNDGDALFLNAQNRAAELGIGISPSLVVNNSDFGSQFDRNPDAIKTLICSGFIDAPEVCAVELGTDASQATGSC